MGVGDKGLDGGGGGVQANAQHKRHKAGGKAKKKDAREKVARHNPKAFSFSGGVVSVQRRAQRSLDLEAKREKANLIPNKTLIDAPPPMVVAVQGPPGVGKSTLIRSLIKHYTRHNVAEVKGSITLVAGRNCRLTFIECPNDAASMLDVAKIADLVLLLIDGSYGFEMETFEFLNMLQVHGFPRVMGVLTHLDKIAESSTLRRTKKKLKNRFWAEIYNGAKLFYLSGLQYQRYNKREILNLSRFISVQKVKPLIFRSQRPHMLCLRCEDQTNGSSPKALKNRTLHLYGYLNGATLRPGSQVHIPGAGDFSVATVTSYLDPCPLPTRGPANTVKAININDGARHLRTLKPQDRRIYAPECDIGNVLYDQDTLYIHLPDQQVGFTKRSALESDKLNSGSGSDHDSNTDENTSDKDESALPEPVALVRQLQSADEALNARLSAQVLRLTQTSKTTLSTGLVKDSHDLEDAVSANAASSPEGTARQRRRAPQGGLIANSFLNGNGTELKGEESDDDSTENAKEWVSSPLCNEESCNASTTSSSDDEDMDPCLKNERETASALRMCSAMSDTESEWSGQSDDVTMELSGSGIVEQHPSCKNLLTLEQASKKFSRPVDLTTFIYQKNGLSDGLPISALSSQKKHNAMVKSLFEEDTIELMEQESARHFMSSTLLGQNTLVSEIDLDETSALADGDVYRSLGLASENTDVVDLHNTLWSSRSLQRSLRKHCFITGGWDGEPSPAGDGSPHKDGDDNAALSAPQGSDAEAAEDNGADAEAEKKAKDQALQNIEEVQNLIRQQESGCVIGTYVRVVIHNVPGAWVDHLKAQKGRCVVMGGLLPSESSQFGLVQTRVKKHRWAPKILKSNDPLLISVGWKRFQTLPLYSIEERNQARMRMLKYTPEHLHCIMTFYGPLQAPGAGIVAIRNWADNVQGFRISATGITLESATDFRIVKKLKLVGEPSKIFKHTAFIKKMFNSDLEVSKCVGAKIQTASGIRGEIKKAQGTDGTFRATFEDKILASDLVFCKAWIRVEPKEFCNPLLDVPDWKRLRTLAEIRHALQIPVGSAASQSDYGKKPERVQRRFNALRIPKDIEKNLPFSARPKNDAPHKAKSKGLVSEAAAVELNPYEKKVVTLFNRLHLITKTRQQERKTAAADHRAHKEAEAAKVQALRDRHTREARKKRHAFQGVKESKLRKRVRMDD